MQIFLYKILEENIADVAIDKYPEDAIVVSVTEKGNIYVADKNGMNKKMTDVHIVESDDELSELSLDDNKIYILNSKDKKAIYVKNSEGKLDDILQGLNNDVSVINNSIDELAENILNNQESIKKNSNDIVALTNYLITAIDELNNNRKKDAEKKFKSVIPITVFKPGVINPIIPIETYTVDNEQTVSIKEISMLNVGAITPNVEETDDNGFELSVSLYDSEFKLVKELSRLVAVPGQLKVSSIIDEANLVTVKEGYIQLEIIKAVGLSEDYKTSVCILAQRNGTYEELEKPTGPVIPEPEETPEGPIVDNKQ